MLIKGLVDEDFINYKKPSMFIVFPYCTFKCEKDASVRCCQNSDLALSPVIEMDSDEIVRRYTTNPISKAIVCGGMEPMDTFDALLRLLRSFRDKTNDDFVIYTGYTKEECVENGWLGRLMIFPNVIVKFGRFIPDQAGVFDDVLGITLASDNQYAERIS